MGVVDQRKCWGGGGKEERGGGVVPESAPPYRLAAMEPGPPALSRTATEDDWERAIEEISKQGEQHTEKSTAPNEPPAQRDDGPCCGCCTRLSIAAKALKRQVLVLYYASLDPAVGILPRLLVWVALAYALSPLDLVPDFIPVLGIIDDLIILPALFWLAFVLIPEPVLAAARKRAESEPLRLSRNIVAGVIFLLVWLASFETAAALLVEHWPFARTHSVAVYIIATLGFFMFAVAGILSESEEARSALQRIACCCERAMPLAEPLLPTTSAH